MTSSNALAILLYHNSNAMEILSKDGSWNLAESAHISLDNNQKIAFLTFVFSFWPSAGQFLQPLHA